MNMKKYISILIVLCSLTWIIAFAHPGRTDSNGGHWVRTEGWGYEVGTYHYHNDGTQKEESYTPPAKSSLQKAEFSGFDFDLEPTYNYSKARKVYEEKQKQKKSFYILIILFLCILPVMIWSSYSYIKEKMQEKKRSVSVPSPLKRHPKQNIIDDYQTIQKIKEENNKLFEALDKKQQALIPEGTAIDENGLPYLINRQYGYGRLYNAFVTKSGNHYHRSRCPEILGHKKKCIHRYNAIKSYQPCIRCKPLRHVDDWYLEYIEIEKTKNNIRKK
jgi:hypothetical protein